MRRCGRNHRAGGRPAKVHKKTMAGSPEKRTKHHHERNNQVVSSREKQDGETSAVVCIRFRERHDGINLEVTRSSYDVKDCVSGREQQILARRSVGIGCAA